MSILFTCPHCGTQTTVAEETASRSEPCAGCGKTITIKPSGGVLPKPSARFSVAKIAFIVLSIVLVASVVSFVHEMPQREAGRQSQCRDNLQQITIALVRYESEHRGFPPAVSTEKDGRSGMGWRVAILRFLDPYNLYIKHEYDRRQAWNGPKNRAIADTDLPVYRCPSDPKGPKSRATSYVMLVGKGTVAGLADKDRNIDYIAAHSGAANTVLLIETPDSGIQWAEPRDLTLDEFIARIKSHKGGIHRGCICAAFCDGHVEFIRDDVSPNVLRDLANPSREGLIDASKWKWPAEK